MSDAPALENASTVASDHEPLRTRTQRLVGFACSVGICLCGYILLAGPMAGLHQAIPFKPFRTAIEFFCAPIVWLTKNNLEPLSSFIKAYVGLFR